MRAMPGPLLAGLALVSAVAAQGAPARIQFELRVFNGAAEVTRQTRVAIHRAGERGEPLVQFEPGTVPIEVPLAPGLYDVQAAHVEDRRVRKIRWALRLVVMPYPDERGRHLEVINFSNGYGALEVLPAQGTLPAVRLFSGASRDRAVPPALASPERLLFVVPAGPYDLQTGDGPAARWQDSLEVPLDRTRVWLLR
jgi:hypothetical protein